MVNSLNYLVMALFSEHPFLLFALIITLVLLLVLLYSVYLLHKKIGHFLKGENGHSLEGTIKKLMHEVEELKKQDIYFENTTNNLEKRLATSLRSPTLLRYKAFEGNASTQSFSLALLNEQGQGTVISSLHVRDRVSIYAKKISKWESEIELTEEEKEVIKETKESQKK